MIKTTRITTALLILAFAFSPAVSADRWLHVRVEESGSRGANVSVNIPLNVVEGMLPLISVDELDRGRLRLDDDFSGIDLREILLALRDGPDTDFVTVNRDDEFIRVAKEDDFLIMRVEEKRRGREAVSVTIPLAVVEALVASDPHELDLAAGLRALSEFDGEDLVRVESEDELIRIWIDSDENGG